MTVVSVKYERGLAVVTMNNPPVNVLNQELRIGLLKASQKIALNPNVEVVILSGAGRGFVAGADIRELGKTPSKPLLPDVLAAIENSSVPWVAALHGMILGGGAELAMACHARIASPNAVIGFPEVNIGIIPGAGGTARLPRLVALHEALKLITTGKAIGAQEAKDIGLFDVLTEDDLALAAKDLAQKIALKGKSAPTLSRAIVGGVVNWDLEREKLRKKFRGAAAPIEAMNALKVAAEKDALVALSDARERFLRLANSDEAAALRYLFFAERGAGAGLRPNQVQGVELSHVGIIGGGTMGVGISTALLLSGSAVHLVERDDPSADVAYSRVVKTLSSSVKRGVISQETANSYLSNFSVGSDYSALRDCQLVIEAVFEDVLVKRTVFEQLEAVMPDDAILATNTSYLDINILAETMRQPERLLGLHFFSPAHIMKLLEVVRGDATGEVALATGGALARRLRKTAVLSGVCDGFIGNRIMARYRSECEFMLEEGTLPHQIDDAMRDFGFAMGIFEVQDLSGLDIAWARRKAQAPFRDQTKRYAHISDRLCDLGRLGRKAEAGWYDYSSGTKMRDPQVELIIEEESARAGYSRKNFTVNDIMDRIMLVMQKEGQAILDEGIAEKAADIDVVMALGYGFPRHRGGPMYMTHQH